MGEEKESRLQFLTKKYLQTGFISEELFGEVLRTDPTTRLDESGSVIKVGKYTQWIFLQYEKQFKGRIEDGKPHFTNINDYVELNWLFKLFSEDLYKVKDDLTIYDTVKKTKLPKEYADINRITNFAQLYDLVKGFSKEVLLTKAEVKERLLIKGLDLLWEDDRWDVVIPKSRDAAIASSGAPLTRWCTASEGHRNIFDTYDRQGPLYMLRDKTQIIPTGRAAGQPTPRYQFHFETQSFMDVEDRRVDVVQILQEEIGMKMFFKPILKRHFLSGKFVQIKFPNDNASKYISLYGFQDYFDSLPQDITDIDIDCGTVQMDCFFELPKNIQRFTKLETIYIRSCVSYIPEEVCSLEQLYCLSFPNCRNLKTMPAGIAKLPNLVSINVKGCHQLEIPDSILEREKNNEILIIQ